MHVRYSWCVRLVLVLAAASAAGCAAANKRTTVSDRLIKRGTPSISYDVDPAETESSLKAAIAKIRAMSLNSKPRVKNASEATIEANRPELAAALRALAGQPTAPNHFAVANLYLELGVRDEAFEHFRAVLKLDRASAAAYEGLARIWRDWDRPDIALADAYRAVHYAPQSAAARNTLGTIFQALGRVDDARAAYVDAVRLNPGAAYALNNLCFLSLHRGNGKEAKEECELALMVDPTLRVARFNLAKAYDGLGQAVRAQEQRRVANDRVMDAFHEGLLHRNRREYGIAAAAFERACLARPSFAEACSNAAEAQLLVEAQTREK
jgi:tetratricopeptide (TPR) repeat protein